MCKLKMPWPSIYEPPGQGLQMSGNPHNEAGELFQGWGLGFRGLVSFEETRFQTGVDPGFLDTCRGLSKLWSLFGSLL